MRSNSSPNDRSRPVDHGRLRAVGGARRRILRRRLKLTEFQQKIADEVIKEIRARLGFLKNVGWVISRSIVKAARLSGGEAQRIRLATQIGAGLVGVLYILDEPSIGLHQRDNERLLVTLEGLRESGQFRARRRA